MKIYYYFRLSLLSARLLWYARPGLPWFLLRIEFGILLRQSCPKVVRQILKVYCSLQELFHWLLSHKASFFHGSLQSNLFYFILLILFLLELKGIFWIISFLALMSWISYWHLSMNFNKAISVEDPDSSGNLY